MRTKTSKSRKISKPTREIVWAPSSSSPNMGWLTLPELVQMADQFGIKFSIRAARRYMGLGLVSGPRKFAGKGNVVFFPFEVIFQMWAINFLRCVGLPPAIVDAQKVTEIGVLVFRPWQEMLNTLPPKAAHQIAPKLKNPGLFAKSVMDVIGSWPDVYYKALLNFGDGYALAIERPTKWQEPKTGGER